MFNKTEGIVLKKTAYAGNGLIVKIYTKEEGVKTYFTRKTKKQKNIFQALSILSVSSNSNPKKDIQNISEVSVKRAYVSIYDDIIKANIFLFVNEILNNVLIEEEPNENLYFFIENSLIQFDKEKLDINFHLYFLMGLTKFLGFSPDCFNNEASFFDFQEGCLIHKEPLHNNYLPQKETALFKKLNNAVFNAKEINLSNAERKTLITCLISYYKYHTNMRELKSLPVLEMVFN